MAGITFDKKVKAIDVKTPKSISKLLDDMSQTGFQGRKLAESVDIIEKMIREKNMTILLGYAGSLSTTGQWRMINWLIENRYIDVLVSTGANISEDIVEAMGYSYLGGNHVVDDRLVFHEGLNRYYDVYGKESDYLEMIEVIAEFISKLEPEYKYSSMEFLHQFGKFLLKKGIRSIVALAAEHNVPVFCPAIVDSPYGDASLVAKSRNFSLTIDNVKDYVQFMTLGEKVKETGVIYIGGGVPKDFIQLFASDSDLLYADRKVPNRQGIAREDLAKKGINSTYYPHKYAVQITTDSPQWGGLSGATFEEAISWGKETRNGKFVQCYCDATIALPIVTHALAERLKNFRRRGTDFSSFLK